MASAVVTDPPREGMKKTKGLTNFLRGKTKRIRGILNGQGRKERRARREARKASSDLLGESYSIEDDASTVYGVDVDNSVVVPRHPRAPVATVTHKTHSADDEPSTNSLSTQIAALQAILLVMDPLTRRFELLQLEFDTKTAIVNDVLAQIPHSVTEDALRNQAYVGISDPYGIELILSLRLSKFCEALEVFLAIPDGMPSKECARLARPILCDENVMAMLRSSGVKPPHFPEEAHAPSNSLSIDEEETITTREMNETVAIATSPSPIKIDTAPAPSLIKIDTAPAPSLIKIDTAPAPTPVSKRTAFNSSFTIVLFAFLAFGLKVSHNYMSSPLEPGQRLSPGSTITKCGLLFFIPTCETNPRLEMSSDGVMTMYRDAKKTVEWQIVGGVCESFESGCMNGAVLKDDGSLVIGGIPVSTVTVMGSSTMSPWPFTMVPTLRAVRAR